MGSKTPARVSSRTLTISTHTGNAIVIHMLMPLAVMMASAARYVTATSQPGIRSVRSQIVASEIIKTPAIFTA